MSDITITPEMQGIIDSINSEWTSESDEYADARTKRANRLRKVGEHGKALDKLRRAVDPGEPSASATFKAFEDKLLVDRTTFVDQAWNFAKMPKKDFDALVKVFVVKGIDGSGQGRMDFLAKVVKKELATNAKVRPYNRKTGHLKADKNANQTKIDRARKVIDETDWNLEFLSDADDVASLRKVLNAVAFLAEKGEYDFTAVEEAVDA